MKTEEREVIGLMQDALLLAYRSLLVQVLPDLKIEAHFENAYCSASKMQMHRCLS